MTSNVEVGWPNDGVEQNPNARVLEASKGGLLEDPNPDMLEVPKADTVEAPHGPPEPKFGVLHGLDPPKFVIIKINQ